MSNDFVPLFVCGVNNYDAKKASDEAVVQVDYGESLTVQAHAVDADLNLIVHRFGITGKMPENPRMPSYGDFSEITDFRSALDAVRNAEYAFMELPAKVRARFDNNPQLLLEFVSNDVNREEARSLGLLKEVASHESVGVGSAGVPGNGAAAVGGSQSAGGGSAGNAVQVGGGAPPVVAG